MTVYEPTYQYYPVDTPLSDYFDPSYEPNTVPYVVPMPPANDRVNQRMFMILAFVIGAIISGALLLPRLLVSEVAIDESEIETSVVAEEVEVSAETAVIPPPQTSTISPIFTPEVQHWAPQITAWATQYELDPDIVATIMQIESCGDPLARSRAGAQGLFQVMPFHFAIGEDPFDPDTNARRGLNFLREQLRHTNGDLFLAFAGYNGGYAASNSSFEYWTNETQRYYQWSKGIYEDAKAGLENSPTIEQWLAAGGRSLCEQAASRLNLQ
ncbi:MAG: hypothetical protein D6706_19790 [Chloroflexi bacterium]|nr:MAG: hypothetical protein D6706_19790 [Chloroflexota bacterium]